MRARKSSVFVIGAAAISLLACGPKDSAGGKTTSRAEPRPEPRVEARNTPPPARRAATLTAAQVIDRAIAAHGGLAKLKAKFSAMQMQTKGTYSGMPYTATMYAKAPHNHVMVIHNIQLEWGTTDTDCWRRTRGIVMDCSPKARESMVQMHVIGSFMALYPLKDPSIKVQRTHLRSDAELRNHLILVKKGDVQAILFFDNKTFQLNSAMWTGTFGQVPVKGQIVTFMSAYKTQEGVSFPTRTTMFFNGKKVMQEEVVSVKLGQVDEAKLKRPAQLAFGAPQEQAAPAHHAVWTKLTAPPKQLATQIPIALKGLYGYAMKNGLKPLPSPPTIHFLKTRRNKITVEVRFAVGKPAKAVAGTKTMGVKLIPAHKVVWALQQGPYENSEKWLKALKKKLRKQRRRVIGNGGMQPLSGPVQGQDSSKLLCAVFFVVKK
ncbi:MAG: hypothetical protein ABI333_00020 [bacterium]